MTTPTDYITFACIFGAVFATVFSVIHLLVHRVMEKLPPEETAGQQPAGKKPSKKDLERMWRDGTLQQPRSRRSARDNATTQGGQ